MQGKLDNALRRIPRKHKLEAKKTMANVQEALKRDNADKDRNVALCVDMMRNRLKKVNEAIGRWKICGFVMCYLATVILDDREIRNQFMLNFCQ